MLLAFPDSGRAPGRGHYERAHSSTERFLAQRARLLRATAIAHLDGEATVTHVTALSGVGRSTFYECFDDFSHALEAVRRGELRRVQRGLLGLTEVVRPDAVSRLCSVWLELIAREPVNALAALEPGRGQVSSGLLAPFRHALARVLPSAVRQRDAVLTHAAACAETSARAVALALLSSSPTPSLEVLIGNDAVGLGATEAGLVLAGSIQRLISG